MKHNRTCIAAAFFGTKEAPPLAGWRFGWKRGSAKAYAGTGWEVVYAKEFGRDVHVPRLQRDLLGAGA